jgi:cobalamin biosynthesis protein CobT
MANPEDPWRGHDPLTEKLGKLVDLLKKHPDIAKPIFASNTTETSEATETSEDTEHSEASENSEDSENTEGETESGSESSERTEDSETSEDSENTEESETSETSENTEDNETPFLHHVSSPLQGDFGPVVKPPSDKIKKAPEE